MMLLVAKRSAPNEYYLRIDQEEHVQRHFFKLKDSTPRNKDGWFETSIFTYKLEVRLKIREDAILINTLDFKDPQYFVFHLKEFDAWYEPNIE